MQGQQLLGTCRPMMAIVSFSRLSRSSTRPRTSMASGNTRLRLISRPSIGPTAENAGHNMPLSPCSSSCTTPPPCGTCSPASAAATWATSLECRTVQACVLSEHLGGTQILVHQRAPAS